MPQTYEGILKGNRISWTKGRPESGGSVRVRVTVVEEDADSTTRGEQMAAALRALAERGGVSTIEDPQAWQRDQRAERELPGRGA
ncbi:hypothetical protein BH23BAC4_BH23BAC4_06450 [soil metagenome]